MDGEPSGVRWFQLTFMVQAESLEALNAEFDEEKICDALPGGPVCYLVSIEQQPTIAESLRATWRRLRSG